ncbi:leucyl/phenylalanyl-tRNA--protein transferase [Corticibacter populi]|uniref:Leucyl/phenylalanyl-tRNA--protein transferase n=1 Tax=Corticibacter populi TaxID=1550736 RepID=A0A3M6QXM8_9BURK|nr:leucyl/phenylalanyl-tRNA--protein transferase [Corticibacter populi]RMX07786.1 leucyl/phenylalanyl-tRNA--protein transferase [Corticibacter populi]RZS35010.1 leucyl/phenylalanyl-tRNA--protein transferase [Corticibacter populi]
MTGQPQQAFAFLHPGDPFPAYGSVSESLGPIAVGADLSPATLLAAYRRGIFPWYSAPPILWWSPDPRMVLPVGQFRLHASLRKSIARLWRQNRLEIRVDSAFSTVLRHCARIYRPGQNGSWIVPEMQAAYLAFHAAGHVHSVETWLDGELAGGLYFVNIGQAVFGESMFALRTDASKIALAALVAMCRRLGVETIDCQQNTDHLAFFGGHEIPRSAFLAGLQRSTIQPQPSWRFAPGDWQRLHPALAT